MWAPARARGIARPWQLVIYRHFCSGPHSPPHTAQPTVAKKESTEWCPQRWQVLIGLTSVSLTGAGVCVALSQYVLANETVKLASKQAKLANDQTFENSDEHKIQEAVKKFMQKQPPVASENKEKEVTTACTGRLRDRLTGWGTDTFAPFSRRHLHVHTTVLTGLFEAGKDTALKQTMAGMQGAFVVQLKGQQKCEHAVFDALGVTGESMLTEVIRRVTKELRSISPAESGSTATTTVPVVVLEVPTCSTVDIDAVSTFAKAFATDALRGERLHVLVVMSSAMASVSFDAGGPNRRFDLFMEFSKEEAIELLKKVHGITNPGTADKIVQMVGTNPGRLDQANAELMSKAIENNKHDDEVMAAISVQYRHRIESEVQALLAIKVSDHGGKGCFVGREMAASLMKGGPVSHAHWRKKEITLVSVAKLIKDEAGHAVYYHTEREEWSFVSRLHRAEAEKQLRQLDEEEQSRHLDEETKSKQNRRW